MTAQTVSFQWRLLYGLPPSDPRAKDIDEGEMIEDLLAHASIREAEQDAANPAAATIRRQIADGTFNKRMDHAERLADTLIANYLKRQEPGAAPGPVTLSRPAVAVRR